MSNDPELRSAAARPSSDAPSRSADAGASHAAAGGGASFAADTLYSMSRRLHDVLLAMQLDDAIDPLDVDRARVLLTAMRGTLNRLHREVKS